MMYVKGRPNSLLKNRKRYKASLINRWLSLKKILSLILLEKYQQSTISFIQSLSFRKTL
jgi:hypothetical protein